MRTPKNGPRVRECILTIARMWDEGYSLEAIACRLNIGLKLTKIYIRQIGLKRSLPEGYVYLPDEAARVGLSYAALSIAANNGELRVAYYGHRRITKREWVDIWTNNHHYRVNARQLRERAFAGVRSTPD